MKIYQLNCPSCGANVVLNKNKKSCFCSSCGNQIYLDDGTLRFDITKNTTHHTIYTDEAKIKEIEYKDTVALRKENGTRKVLLIVFSCIIAFILLYICIFSFAKSASDKQEKHLQEIVTEVLLDIENNDFEAARVKAQTIYYTEGWSSDIEEKWDKTRNELLKQIDKSEKEWKNATQKNQTWWNPFD